MIYYVLIALIGLVVYREIKVADKEYKAKMDLREFENDLKQYGVDKRVEDLIESEAQRLYGDWLFAMKDVTPDDIKTLYKAKFWCWNPNIPAYHVYSIKAVRFSGGNIHKLIKERFDELCKNHKI